MYQSRNKLTNTYRNARLCIYVFVYLYVCVCVYAFVVLWKCVIMEIAWILQSIPRRSSYFLYLIVIPFTIPGILYRYAHPLLVMIEAAGDGGNLITLQLYARYQYISIRLIATLSAH